MSSVPHTVCSLTSVGSFEITLFPLIGQPPAPSALSGHVMSYDQYQLMVVLFNTVCSLVRFTFNFHKFSDVLSQLMTLEFTNMKFFIQLGPELYAIYFSWHEECSFVPMVKGELLGLFKDGRLCSVLFKQLKGSFENSFCL